jgi:hypothetical protein
LLDRANQNPFVVQTQLELIQVTATECRVRGVLLLAAGRRLHVMEYVVTEPTPHCLKYRYHLQRSDGTVLCRWDNAPHHPKVTTYPHHRHASDGTILPSAVRALEDVLASLPLYLDA